MPKPRWRVRVAALIALGGVVSADDRLNAQTARPTNVVVIIADDLGYADIGAQGLSKDVKTPNIDSIAANGVRFTQGYVSCPVCSPTRAGILTGRYQQRFGHEHNPGRPAPENFGLPLDQVTIADDFKHAGYATGAIGKWHLGSEPKFRPLQRGFDEFYGFLSGAHTYLNNNNPEVATPIYRGNKAIAEATYLTDAITRESADFIDRHREKPFFLYVAFNAVHTPMEVTEKYLKRFPDVKDKQRRDMLAMLSAADDGVGVILQHLRDAKLDNNTLIVFLTDNGGPTGNNGSLNTPLSGVKTQVREGGIRVPFMMQWKGSIPAGRVIEQPVISLDILPTALAAAKVPLSKPRDLDGVNLLPLLQGKTNQRPHESLYWRFGQNKAVRKGDWKWVKVRERQPAQVFDLKADPAESHDLAAEKPELAKELAATYAAWDATLVNPLWQPARENADRPMRRAVRRLLNTTQPTTVPADE